MHSSKFKASALVLVMLMAAAFIPVQVSTGSSDADDFDIGGMSVNTDNLELEGFGDILNMIFNTIDVLDGEYIDIDLNGTPEENRESLKEIITAGDESLSDKADTVIDYLGLMPAALLASSNVTGSDADIGRGTLKAVYDVPEHLVKMLTGDDSEPAELYSAGEVGIQIALATSLEQMTFSDDTTNIGLPFKDLIGTISSALGNFGKVFKNIFVTDNTDLLTGKETYIAEGAVYDCVSYSDLCVYALFELDTNVDKVDPDAKPYINYNISLQMLGGIHTEMTKVSGDGPESIESVLELNTVDLGLVLGFSDIDSDEPGFTLGINSLKFDMDFTEDIDGDSDTMNVSNSGIMAFANGIQVTLNDNSGLKHVDIANRHAILPEKAKSGEEKAILNDAKVESQTEEVSSNQMQYMVGGALGIVGLLIICVMRIGKKY